MDITESLQLKKYPLIFPSLSEIISSYGNRGNISQSNRIISFKKELFSKWVASNEV